MRTFARNFNRSGCLGLCNSQAPISVDNVAQRIGVVRTKMCLSLRGFSSYSQAVVICFVTDRRSFWEGARASVFERAMS